ncbi:MAG: GNAT family N-acetyltransferase [Erysipelotrichia bacterium]|nr:GNAT family N-acetyltransferase [Erysipelotrichia bacterium]
MNLKTNEILYSENLNYRLLNFGDYYPLKEIMHDKEICRSAGLKYIQKENEFSIFFTILLNEKMTVAVCRMNQLIGYFHLNNYLYDVPPYKDKKCISLGFLIAKEFQHHGYGSEALKFITSRLKQEYDYCFADCFSENIASQKTILKAEYKYLEDYQMYFDTLKEIKNIQSYVY